MKSLVLVLKKLKNLLMEHLHKEGVATKKLKKSKLNWKKLELQLLK